MNKYLQQAIDLASSVEVQQGKQRLSAICVDSKGRVLSRAVNNYKRSHPLFKHFAESVGESPERIFLHAECSALLKARTKVVETIYVARVLKDNSIALAKPCKICTAALKAFGVKNVVYTINPFKLTDDAYIGSVEVSVENL